MPGGWTTAGVAALILGGVGLTAYVTWSQSGEVPVREEPVTPPVPGASVSSTAWVVLTQPESGIAFPAAVDPSVQATPP